MLRGIERLANDMKARIVGQELVANNLANATTAGFKAQRAFRTLLNQSVKGSAKQTLRLYTSFEQGPIERTDRPLDLAINGEGFFVIDTPFGERYTRCGAFTLSSNGLLTTMSGEPVLGSGGPIPIDGQEITIGRDGTVYVDGDEVGTLRIVRFDDPQRLVREGNRFAAGGEVALPVNPDETEIIQGALERSNVNPIDEMVEMINLHRNFETAQRSIRLQDESARQLIERAGTSGRR